MLKKIFQFRLTFFTLLFIGLTGCMAGNDSGSSISPEGNAASAETTSEDDGGLGIPITIAKVTTTDTVDARQIEGGGDLVEGMVLGATSFGIPFINGEAGAVDATDIDANIVIADGNDTDTTISIKPEPDGSFLADLSSFDLSDGEIHTFVIQIQDNEGGAGPPVYLWFNPDDSILDSMLRFPPFNVTITRDAEVDEENSFVFDNTGNITFNITVDNVDRLAVVPARGGTTSFLPNTDNVVRPVYASNGSFFLYTDSPIEGFRLHRHDISTEMDTIIDDLEVSHRFFALCADDRLVIQEDADQNTVSIHKRDLEDENKNSLLFIKMGKPVDIACLPNSTQGVVFLQQGPYYIAYLFGLEDSHVITPIQLIKTKNAIISITPFPDSSGFVYVSSDSGIKQLHRFTLSDASDVALTDASLSSTSPSVTFDGSFVLFQRQVDTVFQIHAFEFETGKTYQLTSQVRSIHPIANKNDNTFTYKYGDDFQVSIGNLDILF